MVYKTQYRWQLKCIRFTECGIDDNLSVLDSQSMEGEMGYKRQ